MNINYLTRDKIDLKKWDQCIKRAVNGSVFGYSWYLDIISPGWGALVDDHYEHVMPLTSKSCFNYKLLMQPCWAPNLGVYSCQVLDSCTVNAFIQAIPPKFKYVHIRLNKHNKFTEESPKIRDGIHFELDLIENYYKIRSRFSNTIRLGLSVAAEQKIVIVPDLNTKNLIPMVKDNAGLFRRIFFRQRYTQLQMLVSTAVRFRIGKVYGAYNSNNKLCAAAFFIWSHQRVTLLVSATTHCGRKNFAYEAIIDEFIRTHAEETLTLRLEYANQHRFGYIYQGFGAKPFRFMAININRWKSRILSDKKKRRPMTVSVK